MNQKKSVVKGGRLSLPADSFASSNASLFSISNLLGNDSKFILSVNDLSREVNQESASATDFFLKDYMEKSKVNKKKTSNDSIPSKVSKSMTDSWDDFDLKDQTFSLKEETFQRIEDFQNENVNVNVSISDSEFLNMSIGEKEELLEKDYKENENLQLLNDKSFSLMSVQNSFFDSKRGDQTMGEYFLMNSTNPCHAFSPIKTPLKNYLPLPKVALNKKRSEKKNSNLSILQEIPIEENSVFNSFQRSLFEEKKDNLNEFYKEYEKRKLEEESAKYNLSDRSILRGLRELDVSNISRDGGIFSLATSTPRNSFVPYTSTKDSRSDISEDKNDKTLTPKGASKTQKTQQDFIPTKEMEISRKITPNTTYASIGSARSEGSGSSFPLYQQYPAPVQVQANYNQQQQIVVPGVNHFPGYPMPQIIIQVQCPCHQGEHKPPLNVSSVSSCVSANGRNSPQRPNLSTDKEKVEWPTTLIGTRGIEDITFINNSAKELKINCRIVASNQRRTFYFLNAFESSKSARTEFSEFTIVLSQGETKKFEISFSPKEVGQHNGEIKIKFHILEANEPTVAFKAKIPLIGRGK